jgi:polar amino acid transport system permease protein
MRVIVPPTGNETISMLKTTSLVGAALGGGGELYRSIQNIYNLNYLVPPLLITGCCWYLAMTSVLSVGQFYIERYYGRGIGATPPPTFRQTLAKGFGRSPHATAPSVGKP